MNKLTVQFTHQNAKKYSFITNDETIKLGDLVCVTSPVSKKRIRTSESVRYPI